MTKNEPEELVEKMMVDLFRTKDELPEVVCKSMLQIVLREIEEGDGKK